MKKMWNKSSAVNAFWIHCIRCHLKTEFSLQDAFLLSLLFCALPYQSALFLTMYRTCTRWMKIVVHCLPSSAGCRSSRCFAVSPSVRGANGKVMMKDETTEILHICPCTVKLHFFWEPVLKVKNQFCYCTEFEIMWGSTVAWWLALFPQSKKVH